MWRDIFAANRQALLPLVDELVAGLGELREAIAEGDTARIESFLDGGRAARTRLFPP
jgi:prephenate dehydrogenase